jgi:hypothetical protein
MLYGPEIQAYNAAQDKAKQRKFFLIILSNSN